MSCCATERSIGTVPIDVRHDPGLRVVQVVTSLQRGGAERVTIDLAVGLVWHGVRTRVVSLGRPTRRAFEAPPGTIDLSGLGRDRASRAEGVFAPFLGIPASTSKALAVISLRTGAPVVPIFIRRVEGGRHRVEVQPVIPSPAAGDVADYTAAFNRSIEAAVRRAPEQWFWMHNRWKTRPRSEMP